MRRDPFINQNLYHICSKSIAGYRIFREDSDYERMLEMLRYYSFKVRPMRFSVYYETIEKGLNIQVFQKENSPKLVDLIAYCLMPTHIHLLLCQLIDDGISFFMKDMLNSYSRYFNVKYDRKGPLWQGRFKSILIEADEQLLHLTRYIHLNPTSDSLVDKPEKWRYSSYHEYIGSTDFSLCEVSKYLEIMPEKYREFVESRIDYQRILSEKKHLLLE